MRSVTHSVSPPILLSPPPPPPPVEHMLSTALGGGSGCACLCLVRGARVSYHLPENTKTISKEAWGGHMFTAYLSRRLSDIQAVEEEEKEARRMLHLSHI